MLDHVAGSIAFITTLIGIVPQIIKAYQTKSMGDVSMLMLVNCLVCAVAWLVHGLCVSDYTLIWSEVFCTLTTVVAIVQKFKYAA